METPPTTTHQHHDPHHAAEHAEQAQAEEREKRAHGKENDHHEQEREPTPRGGSAKTENLKPQTPSRAEGSRRTPRPETAKTGQRQLER